MLWWYWIVLGLALAALELATPGGFFVIFFAIAALAVGALTLVGVTETPWVQWLLFPAISIVGLRLFRQPLIGRMGMGGSGKEMDTLVGEVAIATPVSRPASTGARSCAVRAGAHATWTPRHLPPANAVSWWPFRA